MHAVTHFLRLMLAAVGIANIDLCTSGKKAKLVMIVFDRCSEVIGWPLFLTLIMVDSKEIYCPCLILILVRTYVKTHIMYVRR